MKVARNVFFGLVVAGAMVFVSGVSFAETAAPAAIPVVATNDVSAAKQVKHEARIKLLQDSAAALQATNPDLAMKLTDIVNGASKEKTEANKLSKDSAEWKARRDARIQLYKDAATALQATNPDLAKGLMDLTVPKQ
jgi:uncharacterized membrane protein